MRAQSWAILRQTFSEVASEKQLARQNEPVSLSTSEVNYQQEAPDRPLQRQNFLFHTE
jgi:hypothetical protein